MRLLRYAITTMSSIGSASMPNALRAMLPVRKLMRLLALSAMINEAIASIALTVEHWQALAHFHKSLEVLLAFCGQA